jgi:glycosyltransferase involved in cell wall biosynthesis
MIKTLPLVSVAVITYNQKEFLIECIESILLQNYDNFQIVIADDYSTDGTQATLFDYETKYPSIFKLILSDVNGGITVNSNRAHFACEGDYIVWMGGDDLMLPNKIASQVEFMENNPKCTILYHNLDVFDSESGKTIRLMNNKYNSHQGNFYKVVAKGVFNGACSTMIRRSKAPAKGFDERIPIASDWLYYMETLLNGGEIRYIDKVLGRYRRHTQNITNYSDGQQNGQIDHLNSCNILLTKVQHNKAEVFKYYSELLRGMRLYDKKNYKEWLCLSVGFNINIKSFLLWIIFLFSLGKIKK